jgi:hypothetical protein
MKTRHTLSIFFFLFFGLILFAAKNPDAKSTYLSQLSSTPTIESFHDFLSLENGKAFIRMYHNDQNIKVQIVVPDKGMQAKFLTQGLQVYLDISGKKGKKYCISFSKVNREQMREGMQMVRQPMQREPGQQQPERRERPEGNQQQINLKPMIEQVGANSALLISGRNETLLDVGRVNLKPFGEEDHLLFTIQMPLSSLGGKVGKDAIVSVGLSAEMEQSAAMLQGGGGMSQGGGTMRTGGPGGGGSLLADYATPFNTWTTFGLK